MTMTLPADPSDHLPWLDDWHGERALAWAAERSAATDAELDTAGHRAVVASVTAALDAEDRLVTVAKHGRLYTNFWQDAGHPRGLWRGTDWESYASGQPNWELLLDLDALAAEEGVERVWAGATWEPAAPGETPERVLLHLSPDGGDATVVREFDVPNKTFVEGGFSLPVAKTFVSWIGRDTLLVSTVLEPDDATRSSYARNVRRLDRGADLAEAPVVFSVDPSHVAGDASHDSTPGFVRDLAHDSIDFYRGRSFVDRGEGWELIDVPEDARVSVFKDWLVVRPMSAWEVAGATHPAGCVVVAHLEPWLGGSRQTRRVWEPAKGEALSGLAFTATHALLTVLRDVSSAVLVLDTERDWAARELPGVPALSTASVWPVDDEDPETAEDYWMLSSGFLSPATLWRGTLHRDAPEAEAPRVVSAAPERFDASGYEVTQRFALSADGTRVPYFLLAHVDDPRDGLTPTLIHAYGGFRTSLTPGYSSAVGLAWLERRADDGRAPAYVVANLRGGGEYGPAWHAAALRENRVLAFQDLAAVAADLHASGLATPKTTGLIGRSNGGLLAGNALTRYPELFGAISCGVPLLDMLRYTGDGAGHSWIAEYGDPEDPADAAHLRELSPLHRLVDSPCEGYPPVLIWTTTSDDRVGPIQARRMAAVMEELGIDGLRFHEDTSGGHAGSIDHADTARMVARSYSFLWDRLSAPAARAVARPVERAAALDFGARAGLG